MRFDRSPLDFFIALVSFGMAFGEDDA